MGHTHIQSDLTAEQLRELLDYDPSTGRFSWLRPASSRLKPGDAAGYINTKGYAKIRVGYAKYSAHRLAWLYAYGSWPDGEIDHINGNRSDNRLENLRDASHAENTRNRHRRIFRDLPRGVKKSSGSRYRATIVVDGIERHLGVFPNVATAAAAYADASIKFHGDFGNAHG